MDKETLSNYGWIVICVLVLAVMLALATPFGTFVADGFKATYTGLFDTGDSALDVGLSAVGVTNTLECGHGRKESGDHAKLGCGHFACEDCGCVPASCGCENHWSGDGLDHTTVVNHSDHTYACECTGWIVPEGGTYTMKKAVNGKSVYNAGEQLPCGYETVNNDMYVEGDYKYIVEYDNFQLCRHEWAVHVLDKTKTEYGEIRSSINNRDVMLMNETFSGCTNLKKAPSIPNSITSMEETFYNCTALTDVSNLIISSNVLYMPSCFFGCTSLSSIPDMVNATNLIDIGNLFRRCPITTAPVIPSSVKDLAYAFQGCTSLTGVITIHADEIELVNYNGCFWDVDFEAQNITLVGSSSMLDKLGGVGQGKNYCVDCNGKCQGNH